MQVDFTCSLGPEDWGQAFRLHNKPGPASSYLGLAMIFLCGLLFLDAVYGGFSGKIGRGLLAILTGFFGGCVWFYQLYIPRVARRAHAHTKSWHGLMRVLVDDAGVQLHTDCLNQSQPWSHFVMWKENKNLFLVYESDLIFSLLFPKRCMDPETIANLRGILAARISPAD